MKKLYFKKHSLFVIVWLLAMAMMTIVLVNKAAADESNLYLWQAYNQLNEVIQTLQLAETQNTNPANTDTVNIHYHPYRDNNGILHPGLLDDANHLKIGVGQALLLQQQIKPRVLS